MGGEEFGGLTCTESCKAGGSIRTKPGTEHAAAFSFGGAREDSLAPSTFSERDHNCMSASDWDALRGTE